MNVAKGIGQSSRTAVYQVPDTELAVGSTLGGPKAAVIIKASGAIQKIYNSDMGETLFGTILLRHYDGVTGMELVQESPGTFVIHPEHQEHAYSLANGVQIREDIFVLNGPAGNDGSVDPP